MTEWVDEHHHGVMTYTDGGAVLTVTRRGVKQRDEGMTYCTVL
jgi:hypothetical protein